MTLKIGENLKKLRQQNKLTQEQLADILDVTPQAVSRWEKESAYPNVCHFVNIANYFSVSIEELIGEENLRVHEKKSMHVRCDEKKEKQSDDLLDEVIRITATVLCSLIEEKKNNGKKEVTGTMSESVEMLGEQLRRAGK